MSKIAIGRRAGRVVRYHTTPTLVREDVAQHTFNVMNILMFLHDGAFPPILMEYALLHDQGEWKTGDIPSPVKRAAPSIKKIVDEVEAEALPFQLPKLTDGERAVFKLADNLDGLLKCTEELRMGNMVMEEIGDEYVRYIEALGAAVPPSMWDKAIQFINEYERLCNGN